MELRHLQYFVALAEELSFTHAARKLHVSQPSLSRQLRKLEDELGVKLVERSGKKVALTAHGQRFLKDARRLLDLSRDSVERVRKRAAIHPENRASGC